jgi:hypothetical protein
MPGKKAMPSKTAKENRQYEHIKASEKKEGRSTAAAKRIAAATVNKQHTAKGHSKHKTTSKKK